MMLPLAEATTIGFSMPIFATILGALVLGEATGWRRWSAVLAGFVGVVIVTGAGGSAIPPLGALSGLAAAVLTATVSILLRQIGRTEAAMTTVFWFSFLSLLPLGVVLAFTVRAHPPIVWVLLLGIGLVGGCAQLAMTGSLSRGAVSIVVPMDYSSLVWATAFGWLIFGTLPVTATWIGAPIIITSGLYIVWREHLRRREETRQAIAQGVS
jgi:drug/metabolite transporter (DMT)-like permease